MTNPVVLSLLFFGANVTAQEMFLKEVSDNVMPWWNKSLSADERTKELIKVMTFKEKVSMMTRSLGAATETKWTGGTAAIDRLMIPEIRYEDGPQGFRTEANAPIGTTTAFPSLLSLGMTWDRELVYAQGKAMGEEFFGKGAHVQLGPGMNVQRVPTNGRNFEYISGEDPIVGRELVGHVIKGIQDAGVMANAKHFAFNSQETERLSVSENVDERTQFEMYYPPFQAAFDAGVGSVMCSYNKINHSWSCENHEQLTTHLRDLLGFKGFVMSDWGATHSTSLLSGLDQELNNQGYEHFNEDSLKGFNQTDIDKSIYRIFYPFFDLGILDKPRNDNIDADVRSQEHTDVSQKVAEESMILLRNDNVCPAYPVYALPFPPPENAFNVQMIGTQHANPVISGGGSGVVHENSITTPLDAMCDYLDIPRINATGLTCAVQSCNHTNGNCVVYNPTFVTNNGGNPYHDDFSQKPVTDYECYKYTDIDTYDATIVAVGIESSEGVDLSSLDWSKDIYDAAAYQASLKHPGRKIMHVVSAGPMLLNVTDQADAVLLSVMPGEDFGKALVRVLFNDVNPSGKLTFTMPNIANEQDFTQEQYPGLDNSQNVTYTEKHQFGYRYYDAHQIKPKYAFGHGLSYSAFNYTNLTVGADNRTFSLTVQNVGDYNGSEVVQLYLTTPETENFADMYRAPVDLKGFAKVKDLAVNATTTVEIKLDDVDFSFWDVKTHSWKVESGTYEVNIGSSSRDFRLKTSVTI